MVITLSPAPAPPDSLHVPRSEAEAGTQQEQDGGDQAEDAAGGGGSHLSLLPHKTGLWGKEKTVCLFFALLLVEFGQI